MLDVLGTTISGNCARMLQDVVLHKMTEVCC